MAVINQSMYSSFCNLASHSSSSIVHSLSYFVKYLRDKLMNVFGLVLGGYEESSAYCFLILFSCAITIYLFLFLCSNYYVT